MRLFIALDIDDAIRERLARFVEGICGFAPDARWARPESLHVTLKFIGEKPESLVEPIMRALTFSSSDFDIRFKGYGFFPNPSSARVFWVGIEAGPQLASLAATVDEKMAALGIPREEHVFSPHLTLARVPGRSGSPRQHKEDGAGQRDFKVLQEKLSALPTPEFGTMMAHEFFLYQSQLSPKGSKYTKLARFALQK